MNKADKNLIECWQHNCSCGHINYFKVVGGADIICHRCFSYDMTYKGRTFVSEKEWKRSMFPGREEQPTNFVDLENHTAKVKKDLICK